MAESLRVLSELQLRNVNAVVLAVQLVVPLQEPQKPPLHAA